MGHDQLIKLIIIFVSISNTRSERKMKAPSNDNIYLNLSINPDGTAGNSIASFDENFSRPILMHPEEYYCAVARFSVPLSEIPILKFPLDVNQNNNLVSGLAIGIKTAGLTIFSQPVRFIAQNNVTLPVAGGSAPYFTNLQALSKAYDIFNVNAFLTMINTALAAAVTASAIGGTAPEYTWNPATQLMSLQCTAGFIATGATIFMNEGMQNYLAGFRTYQNFNNTINTYEHVLTPLPFGQTGPYTFDEDFTSISLWFDITKIVLTSSTLPVNQEISPVQDPTTGLTQGTIGFTPILTDFLVALSSTNDILTRATYTPDTYRLIDMASTAPINKLNLQFFWVNKAGSFIPLEISSVQVATVKLYFGKKSLYNNEY